MIKAAGYGFAVENAVEALKAVAHTQLQIMSKKVHYR